MLWTATNLQHVVQLVTCTEVVPQLRAQLQPDGNMHKMASRLHERATNDQRILTACAAGSVLAVCEQQSDVRIADSTIHAISTPLVPVSCNVQIVMNSLHLSGLDKIACCGLRQICSGR